MVRTVTLRPGAKGTIGLTRTYGEALICVRYRYDARHSRRRKTIELVVDEVPWQPPPPDRVFVKTYLGEAHLRKSILNEGGVWHPDHKLWEIPIVLARKLDIEDRIATPQGNSKS